MSSELPEPHQQWMQRIASVQRDRATPEQLSAMRARAEASRHAALTSKKASRMSRSLALSSSVFSAGVQEAASLPASATPHRYRSAMAMLASPAFLSPSRHAAAPRSIEMEEEEEAELEQELASEALQQAADGAIAMTDVHRALQAPAEVQAVDQAQKLEETLAQLETEPSEAAACAAKFELYEGYVKLTEDARTATLELWETAKNDFDAAQAATTRVQIEREIEAIDRPDNLGIHEDPSRWFVHAMCRTVCRNQRTLNGVLSGIHTKLELLASQTECPVCFDAFGPEQPSVTLGCAHKCCASCWGHWSTMARGNVAPCPLCRNEEFLRAVLAAAAGESPVAPIA